MERQSDKINRQVNFMHAPPYDAEESSGVQNTWLYDRAPQGYKFILDSVDISGTKVDSEWDGIFAIYDGHEYTHWNIYPGVESKELLGRCELISQDISKTIQLHNWECKEYTMAVRGTNPTNAFKVCIIVWYYLRKMSWLEKLQYA
ncbi:unnamed protein product, partial [marine sediment metagenome]